MARSTLRGFKIFDIGAVASISEITSHNPTLSVRVLGSWRLMFEVAGDEAIYDFDIYSTIKNLGIAKRA